MVVMVMGGVQKVSGLNKFSVMAIEQNEDFLVSKVQPHKGLPLAHEKSVPLFSGSFGKTVSRSRLMSES